MYRTLGLWSCKVCTLYVSTSTDSNHLRSTGLVGSLRSVLATRSGGHTYIEVLATRSGGRTYIEVLATHSGGHTYIHRGTCYP